MPIADTPPRRHALERLAIAGGGTAGHVYPAVALAEVFRQVRPALEVLFIGTATGCEARIAPAHGLRFEPVRAAPFHRVGTLARVRTVSHLLAGVVDARHLLRAHRIQLVLGLGGFASAGVAIAARTLRVPAVLHEANATPGLANRLLARLADRILLGVAGAARDFPLGRSRTTGTPVRPSLLTVAARRAPPWTPASERPFRLLVMGGSQGSPFLNARVPDLAVAIARLGIPLAVQHQTGTADLEPVRTAYGRAGVPADVAPFLDEVGTAYRHADFAITCAGAGTLAELAALGLPALVVPLASAARNHEAANARAAAASGVWWTTEGTWDTTTLAERIAALAADPAAWRRTSARIAAAATPAAAMRILAACDDVFAGNARSARRA